MAGILANSASKTMVSGDTSVDDSETGYLAREAITLSTTGTPTTRLWALAKPSGSGSLCVLSSDTGATPTFTPDVEGYYVVTCLIDGVTLYILRIAVASVANISTLTAFRLLPVANATVPTPASGATVFYSTDESGLAAKLSDGSVVTLDVTA